MEVWGVVSESESYEIVTNNEILLDRMRYMCYNVNIKTVKDNFAVNYEERIMKQSKQTVLSKFDLEIMHIIWDKGKATVQEVKDALSEQHPGAYSTFMTMMRRMESKGILKHEMHEDGRTYVYIPMVSREEVSAGVIQDIYQRLFRGSSDRLFDALNALFRKEEIKPEEIKRLRELIAEKGEQDE